MHEVSVLRSLVLPLSLQKVRVPTLTSVVSDVRSSVIDHQIPKKLLVEQARIS
jgi:hypothetical protein